MQKMMRFAVTNPIAVLLLCAVIVVMGLYSMVRMPLDAFPDTTPVMVHVNASAPELGPLEIEEQILRPLERKLLATSKLAELRSLARFGFGQIILIFEEGSSLPRARQSVLEKLQGVELLPGLPQPEMGPPATGMGEVFHYTLKSSEHNLKELMDFQRYEIEPELASVPGVAEVNAWGGRLRRIEARVHLQKLQQFDLSLNEVFEALSEQAGARGGGGIALAGEYHLVQGDTRFRTLKDIEEAVIQTVEGVAIQIKDVATVVDSHAIRRGAVSMDAQGEVLLGLGFMTYGENGRQVSLNLKDRLQGVLQTLPESIQSSVIYSRDVIVDAVLNTAFENLMFGSLLVFVVLLFFLGDPRSGMIVALSMPFCLLFAFTGMRILGIPGTLISLGAIDFGLVVDSTVILVENCFRRLQKLRGEDRREAVIQACMEMRQATIFGELILIIAYLPVLLMPGSEGRLFRPMAITIMLALMGSFIWSVFIVPPLTDRFLKIQPYKRSSRGMRTLEYVYIRLLKLCLPISKVVLGVAVIGLVSSAWLASTMGGRYLPRLEENAIVISTVRLPGISLEENLRQSKAMEEHLKTRFPNEIESVLTRIGTAQLATDPMGLEQADVFLNLKSQSEWRRASNQRDLQNLIRASLSTFSGMKTVFTQPIEMRMNEMEAGIRADLGILIYGDDLELMAQRAIAVEQLVAEIQGAVDVSAEKVLGGPLLLIQGKPEQLGRYGFSGKDVLDLVAAMAGVNVNLMVQGEKRYEVAVRLKEADRQDPEKISELLLQAEDGTRVRLGDVAEVRMQDGPVLITREKTRRRVVVQSGVNHPDMAGFANQVQAALEREFEWNQGLSFELGGKFKHYESARTNMWISMSLTLVLIFALLQMSTSNLGDTLSIMSGAPFAAVGGILALYLADLPFSVSAGVGFVIVCGVSMLNGLVLLSTIRGRSGHLGSATLCLAGVERLRPVVMTAMVAFFGFLPMAFSTGVGAEIQRPLALVVAGGVVSDTLLTLLVLPCILQFRLQR